MSDSDRELSELKREVVEARNQAIKSDNQVKNLALDIRGFEKRFDGLESRARLASVGVHAIVAITLGIAAYAIGSVRERAAEHEIANLQATLKEEHASAQVRADALRAKLGDTEKQRRVREQAGETGLQLVALLDARQDKEAGALLNTLDLTQLTSLEQQLVSKRFADLRHREADAAFRAGRSAAYAGRPEAAVGELQRSLVLETDGRQSPLVRYLLATSLYNAKRYGEAEPMLKALADSADASMAEEGRYYHAATQARLGRGDAAKSLFMPQAAAVGRFSGSAKIYLAALEAGGDLPTDLPGGRVRSPPRRTDAPPAPVPSLAPAPTAEAMPTP